jgi:pimeloyl-ACP methyl ester carboxylesterase
MESAQSPEVGTSITAGGLPTNVHMRGETGETILLLHGSGPGASAYANWRLTMPALEQHFRVIAPDLLGFGYTGGLNGEKYTLQRWVDHIVSLLDTLNLHKVHVVGNSFGGLLALSLAHQHPARVNRLVLMGAVAQVFPITAGLDAVWGYEPSVENMLKLMQYFAYDQSLVGEDLARLRYAASIRPGVHEEYSQMFPVPRQKILDQMCLSESDLASIHQQTLIVHGREDQVIPVESSINLFRILDNAQLHVFGKCGHWTQIEKADQFNQLLMDFLSTEPQQAR